MKYEMVSEGTKARLHIHEELRSSDRVEFDTMMGRLLSAAPRDVDVDLEGLDYMDSVGLGLLITLWDQLATKKASLQISHAQGDVKTMLDMARLDQLFTVRH